LTSCYKCRILSVTFVAHPSREAFQMSGLPDLSRFELQCLRKLWTRGQATVREIHGDLTNAPSYSTVRKIVERLEEKGAVERVRKQGKAWVYRSAVSPGAILNKEIRRFLDTAFDGAAAPLVARLADMNEVTVEDLREIEAQVGSGDAITAEGEPDGASEPEAEGAPDHGDEPCPEDALDPAGETRNGD
jgi:BlaI family penicillinase repressor